MDELWLEAPAPALKLWHDEGALQWRLNPAAQAWSQERGVAASDWQAAAVSLADALATQRRGEIALAQHRLRWNAVAIDAATVCWLVPQAVLADAHERLRLLQSFGRIALFERDLRSGEARWDEHMFRLFGLDPALGAPSFDAATRQVHPDDRERMVAAHREFVRAPGRYESLYRVQLPEGQLRDLHALLEVRGDAEGHPATMLGIVLDDTESADRVRAEQAQRDELADALRLAGVSVWRIDLARRSMSFNATGYNLLGLPPSAQGVSLETVRNLIHPDDRQRVVDAADEAMRGSAVVDVTARYLRDDGSVVHLLTRRAAVRDAGGRVVALAGISLDQTAAEHERERSHALRRSIELVASATGVGLWSIDLGSRQVEWNAQMAGIYGLDAAAPAPTLRHWIGRLVHPQDRRRVLAARRAALRAGERVFEVEFRVRRPDGGTRWVVCRASDETRAGRRMLVGLHLDVSERRATEAELRLQQDRLETATRAAGLGVWERNAEGWTVYWDAQMFRLRGVEPPARLPTEDEFIAMGNEQLHSDMHQRALHSMRTGAPYEHEYTITWPDGSQHWLLTVGTVRRDAAGRALGIIGVNMDVTQRRRAEQALRERDAAERANRSKSEFLARMSHELRTPLNAVLGFAQLIEHDGLRALPAAQLERVSRIRTAGQHLLALIEDVLDLSAVEAGTLPLAAEPVSLDAALDEVAQWVAPLADRHRVALHRTRSGAWVRGDPRRVRQVLSNLLTNAIKYNRPGGNVWVEAQPGEARSLVVVRDDGRGLSEAQREHLFEPFNRLGAERDGVEGVGLGLVVVRRLVEVMGGRIEVRSAAGEGTEMRVQLAATAAGDEAPVAPPPTAAGRGDATAPLALLYIEDNPVNLLLVKELVALRSNVRMVSAPDGLSGVARALADRPDVVLVDMQLPDIDGHEVLRRLRASPEMLGSTLIALSANAMPEDVARARRAGFDDYWTKPIDFRRFLDGLDALARARRT